MSILEPSDFKYIADLVLTQTGVLVEEEQHDFVRKRVLPIAREVLTKLQISSTNFK